MSDVHSTSKFTAERYLLGELSAEERERFEEHYFSCPECAEQVLAGAAFVDNARAVLPEMAPAAAKPRKERSPWFSWTFAPQLAMACALLIFATAAAYQNLVELPRLRAAASNQGFRISGAQFLTARRAASDTSFSIKDPAPVVVVPNEWEESFPRYLSEIRTGSGSQAASTSSSVEAARSLVISIPVARLGAGKYTMMLYGVSATGSRQVVGQYPFSIHE